MAKRSPMGRSAICKEFGLMIELGLEIVWPHLTLLAIFERGIFFCLPREVRIKAINQNKPSPTFLPLNL